VDKKFYLSKTFWVNILALVGTVVFGKELDPQIVAAILIVVNLLLRAITKTNLTW